MAVFKCKMCGGALEVGQGESVAVCPYCETKQTLPRLDDERRVNLYDRANHFRRNNEFDKASGIYEQILTEDKTDAEAYWSLVLCRFGIEYVEDPATHKRIPTVNRAQFTSVFDDDNYKSALEYADLIQRGVYEEEAKAINEIQKGILAISQQEKPFDVFICYKETDPNGRRTPDSVLATELYHELCREGFKVFFSRITLEDKLGTAYEPYIFAALNSSKVMVVLGTKAEYFNAVWVKNEWSRYLALIKNGAGKMLIPAYKDMDPYDLPEEFSHLQALDMSKLGFMQDLVRGIKKIVGAETPAAVNDASPSAPAANVAPLLKRAFMFLEDGEWQKADDFCEQVLNSDPELAEAYLGKLLAELHVKTREGLKDCAKPFAGSNHYQKAIRFGDEALKAELQGAIEHINTRNKNARLEEIYSSAKNAMQASKMESDYLAAAKLFAMIPEYKDAEALEAECREKAEIARKDNILLDAKAKMMGGIISYYEAAIELFESIPGWEDADQKCLECKKKIEELRAQEEADRIEREQQAELARQEEEKRAKRAKIRMLTLLFAIVAVAAIVVLLNTVIIPSSKYNKALDLMEKGELDEAYSIFQELGGYKDSADKAEEIRLLEGLENIKVGDIVEFGTYEQDNNTSNGKEKIEWLVLEVKDGKALVISKYALDCEYYDCRIVDGSPWSLSELRGWLNDHFLDEAFSRAEKKIIPTVTVEAHPNPEYDTDPGYTTQDQVFLLSIEEVNKYFSSDEARRCEPTDYAVANGTMISDGDGNCYWWLRSPGKDKDYAVYVDFFGAVNAFGDRESVAAYAVRPALWIDLES